MKNTDLQSLIEYRVTNGIGYRNPFYDYLLKKPVVNEEWLREYLEFMIPSHPSKEQIQRSREIAELNAVRE